MFTQSSTNIMTVRKSTVTCCKIRSYQTDSNENGSWRLFSFPNKTCLTSKQAGQPQRFEELGLM